MVHRGHRVRKDTNDRVQNSSEESNTINSIPTATTTYYVRAEGCDTTATASILITVETLSQDATGISASNTTVCSGDPVTLTAQGGALGTAANEKVGLELLPTAAFVCRAPVQAS